MTQSSSELTESALGLHQATGRLVLGFSLAECIARDDAKDDGLETVVVGRRLTDDAANRGHVVIVETSAQRVGHQVFRERLNELMIGPIDQRPAQIVRSIDRRTIRQLTGRLDWRLRVGVVDTELTHRVEILQREPEWIHHAVTGEARRLLPVLLEPRPQCLRRLTASVLRQ